MSLKLYAQQEFMVIWERKNRMGMNKMKGIEKDEKASLPPRSGTCFWLSILGLQSAEAVIAGVGDLGGVDFELGGDVACLAVDHHFGAGFGAFREDGAEHCVEVADPGGFPFIGENPVDFLSSSLGIRYRKLGGQTDK